MTNYETNPEKIKEAFEKGIITESDYLNWTGAQGYKNALSKAEEAGVVTKSVFQSETNKVDSLYFERDFGANTFRFVLKGEIFKPLDLIKSNEPNLLDHWIPPKRKLSNPNIKAGDITKAMKPIVDSIVANINHFTKSFDSIKLTK